MTDALAFPRRRHATYGVTMSKKELADHLADVHGIWLTRREYREMSYEDVQAIHDNAHAAREVLR